MPIVVLIGHIGSGKTTAANILKRHGYIELTFAEPLKTFAKALQFSDNELNGTQAEKLELNPLWRVSSREFMQRFGTEICKNILPNVIPRMSNLFIKVLEFKLLKNINKNIVISDCRFMDEIQMAKKYNAIIVKLLRTCDVPFAVSSHQSETSLDQYDADVIIYNEGNLNDLESDLADALSQPINMKYWFLLMIIVIFGNLLLIAIIAECFIN
jgi:hypothetical protein